MGQIIDVDFEKKIGELRISNTKISQLLRDIGVQNDRIDEVESFLQAKIKEMSDKIVDVIMGV